MCDTRKATNRLLELVEEGVLDKDTVIMACVKWMTEDDVAAMCHANEIRLDPEEDDEEQRAIDRDGDDADQGYDRIVERELEDM